MQQPLLPQHAHASDLCTPGLACLSPEILYAVLSSLKICDVGQLASVSCALASSVSDDRLWNQWARALDLQEHGRCAVRRCATGCTTWEQLSATFGKPAPHSRQSTATAGLGENSFLLQGGRNGTFFNEDCWCCELSSQSDGTRTVVWTELPKESGGIGPGQRANQDATVLGNRFFVIHGGSRPQGYRDNDTFILDLGACPPCWEEVTRGVVHDSRRPTARFHHTFTRLGHGRGVAVVGGHNKNIQEIEDVALLEIPADGHPWAWRMAPQRGGRLSAIPNTFGGARSDSQWGVMCRAYHSASALGCNHIAIFGGLDEAGPTNDLWLIDSADEIAKIIKPKGPLPPPRSRHVSIVQDLTLIVIGGENVAPFELWTIDLGDVLETFNVPHFSRAEYSITWHMLECEPQMPQLGLQRREWLSPYVVASSGQLLIFGGYKSTASFDRFGDPSVLERGQITGGVVGSFMSILWHPVFRSRRGLVLSSTCCVQTADEALPLALVNCKDGPYAVASVSGQDGNQEVAVYSLSLRKESKRSTEFAARAALDLDKTVASSRLRAIVQMIKALTLRLCRVRQR